MTRKCIMCESAAGSKEHVFPAAFGGRRMDKGIYCEKHNKELGRHVTALLDCMSYFNAQHAVRSDHHDQAKPYVFAGENGGRYQVLKNRFEVAPPLPLASTPALVGHGVELEFADEKQADKWLAEQRRQGYRVDVNRRGRAVKQYFTEPLHLSIKFDDSFLRGVAYVGLTYFAHYFPEFVRQDGSGEIKSYVLGSSAEAKDYVWWADQEKTLIPADPDPKWMHSVVLGVSAKTGKATALVTFFRRLSFAVDLGSVPAKDTCYVVTHVNPLAERAGRDADIKVLRMEDVEVVVNDSDEGREYLRAVTQGVRQNPVVQVLSERCEALLDEDVVRILESLQEASLLPELERKQAVHVIVEKQSQRIYNMLAHVVQGFVESSNDLPEMYLQKAILAIKPDDTIPSGLSESAINFLNVAINALFEEIFCHIEKGTLTHEQLKLLIADGPGAAIVGRAVLLRALDVG